MASPDAVGSTLLDAAGQTYLGERDAIDLAFNDTGLVEQQQNLTTENPGVNVTLPPEAQLTLAEERDPNFTITSAYALGTPPPLSVPNTLPAGVPGSGDTFDATAIAVDGTLPAYGGARSQDPAPLDFYSFDGSAGQLMSFQIISNTNTQNPSPDPGTPGTDRGGAEWAR